MIYDRLFKNDYFIRWLSSKSALHLSHDLSILITCSTIHTEACPVLYNHSVFNFCLTDVVQPDWTPPFTFPYKQLMHIKIIIGRHGPPDFELSSLISQFTGSAIHRSTFVIALHPCSSLFRRLDSEVIRLMGTLVGFQTVRLRFRTVPISRGRARMRIIDTSWRNVAQRPSQAASTSMDFYEERLAKAVERLELGLGEAVIRDMDVTDTLHARCVEFKPRV